MRLSQWRWSGLAALSARGPGVEDERCPTAARRRATTERANAQAATVGGTGTGVIQVGGKLASGVSTRRLGFTSNAEPSASKEVSKRRSPWERETRRSDVGQDRSTKAVARANLAAHIDSIARPPPPGRPRAVDWHAVMSQDACVSVSHTSRGRTSSRLHLATCSRARPRALVVAQPCDAGGC